LLYAGDGYVGVFADSRGTVPCAVVPPYTGAILYVYAVTDGASARGITGAEFRIEVSNARGWGITYSAPGGASTVLGNPLDKEPNTANNKGVSLTFAECQIPVNNRIPLGALSVVNYSGSPTNFTVKRHENSKTPLLLCPLFSSCGSPSFSPICMTTSSTAPPCSTLSPQRISPSVSESDPAVFVFSVNQELTREPPVSTPFDDYMELGRSALWVSGRQINDPNVTVHFDGESLHFNDIDLLLPVSPPPVARTKFDDQVLEFITTARAAYAAGNDVLAEVRNSSLVEEAAIEAGRLSVRFRGKNYYFGFDLRAPQKPHNDPIRRTQEWKARELISDLKGHLTAFPTEGLLILVSTGGGVHYLGGTKRESAEVQIRHLLAGESLKTLPDGPLDAQDRVVQEIIAAR